MRTFFQRSFDPPVETACKQGKTNFLLNFHSLLMLLKTAKYITVTVPFPNSSMIINEFASLFRIALDIYKFFIVAAKMDFLISHLFQVIGKRGHSIQNRVHRVHSAYNLV